MKRTAAQCTPVLLGRALRCARLAPVVVSILLLTGWLAQAEVVEEIVARVNDDIITSSELREAEQQLVEDILSKNKTDTDVQIAAAKTGLLRDMITKRLLVQQAERLYDLTKMQDAFVRQFKDQQKIPSNAELEKMLGQEGLTIDDFKRKLVEINAPNSVVDIEVRSKISVSDTEVETFYKAHSKDMASPDKASFREILLLTEGRTQGETVVLAKTLVDQAKGGARFADLARDNSQVDANLRGNLLGPFTKGELAPELEAVVFSMKPGDISDPIVVGATVHVVRLESREESTTPPLDAALKDKITNQLERQKFDAALDTYLTGLWEKSKIHVGDEYMQRLPTEFRKYVKD